MQVGTDPNRANSFGQAVGTTPFPQAISPILNGLKKRAFADDAVSPGRAGDHGRQSSRLARHGAAFGTALERHLPPPHTCNNGSVPTLYDLLHPDQRPAKFATGNREFDPVKIGYQDDVTATGPAMGLSDTSQSGNSNIGHGGEAFWHDAARRS